MNVLEFPVTTGLILRYLNVMPKADVSVRLCHEPIHPQPPVFPTDGNAGAILEFYGVVRGLESGKAITGLQYEAYESMALHQFQLIIDELLGLFPIDAVSVLHRVGVVKNGEPSLHVRIQSKHRQEALHFMGELISRMKADVPIWKAPIFDEDEQPTP